MKINDSWYNICKQYFLNLSDDIILGMDAMLGIKVTIKKNVEISEQITNTDGLSSISDLSHQEYIKLEKFIKNNLKEFENLHGPASVEPFELKMENFDPIKQRYFPRNPAMQEISKKLIQQLLYSMTKLHHQKVHTVHQFY